MSTKLILDTNVFIEGSITLMPSTPTSIASYCNALKIDVFIPRPCMEEVIQKNLERFRDKIADINEAVSSYKKQIDGEFKQTEPMSEEKFFDSFTEGFQSYLKESSIDVLDYPEKLPPIPEVFLLATQKNPPFNEKGNNFRDAVISYCVKDVCETLPDSEVLFVTKDNEFKKLILKMGLKNLKTYSESDVEAELESRLDKKLLEFIEEQKQEIKSHINDNLKNELLEFCTNEARFDIKKLGGYSEEVVSINELHNLEVEAIEDFQFLTDKDSKPFHVTAVVLGSLNVSIKTSQATKDAFLAALSNIAGRPRKVGDMSFAQGSAKESVWHNLQKSSQGYYEQIVETRDIDIVIDLKAEVEQSSGEITNVNFIAANHSQRSFYDYRPLNFSSMTEPTEKSEDS